MFEPNVDSKPVSTLVVCSANICRSPTAGFALSQFGSLRVESAGLGAVDGANICPIAAERLSEVSNGHRFIEEFSSQPIAEIDLDNFELILTATGAIRGAILQDNLHLRDRTFTLIEAYFLAEQQLSYAESALLARGSMSEVLVRRRGTLPTLAPKHRWRHRTGPSRVDIVDTHGGRSQTKHKATIELALKVGSGIGESLTKWRANPGNIS